MKKIVMTMVAVAAAATMQAQTPLDWHLQAPGPDSIWGASINKAYDVLQGKKAKKRVTVAIISQGFDTEHEDLVDVLWTNKKEKAGNQADDDRNGYADDVHGWNFLGTKEGRDVVYTRDEVSRQMDRHRGRIVELFGKGRQRSDWENAELMGYIQMARKSKAEGVFMQHMFQKNIAKGMEELDQRLHEKYPDSRDFTLEQFNTLAPTDSENQSDSLNSMAFYVNSLVWSFSGGRGGWNERFVNRHAMVKKSGEAYAAIKAQQKDERSLIGDNLAELEDSHYGNGNLLAGNPSVGTGLAGLIGARRGNDIGIDGIADNVSLMLIRAVPEGDEYDKDIAEAILYAVDNGADIILVAAHKLMADNPAMMAKALGVAEQRDVLVVHPVGQMAFNEDTDPSALTVWKQKDVRYTNMISVAASEVDGFPLPMTNYGRKSVDLFAPGSDIYSCDAGDNYFKLSGTNAAGAVVTGVAALLKSRFPKLTASQLRDCIVSTATVTPKEGVYLPFNPQEGTNNVQPSSYDKLCVSGGLLDAAAAAAKASTLK